MQADRPRETKGPRGHNETKEQFLMAEGIVLGWGVTRGHGF